MSHHKSLKSRLRSNTNKFFYFVGNLHKDVCLMCDTFPQAAHAVAVAAFFLGCIAGAWL